MESLIITVYFFFIIFSIIFPILSITKSDFQKISPDYQKDNHISFPKTKDPKKLNFFFLYNNPTENNTTPLEIQFYYTSGDYSIHFNITLHIFYSENDDFPLINDDLQNSIFQSELIQGQEIITPVQEITLPKNLTKKGNYYLIFRYENETIEYYYESRFTILNQNIYFPITNEMQLTYFTHLKNELVFHIPENNVKNILHFTIIHSISSIEDAIINFYDKSFKFINKEKIDVVENQFAYFNIEKNVEYYITVDIANSISFEGYHYQLAVELTDAKIKKINSDFNSNSISNNLAENDYMYFYLDCGKINKYVYLKIEADSEVQDDNTKIDVLYSFEEKDKVDFEKLNYTNLNMEFMVNDNKEKLLVQYNKIVKKKQFLFLKLKNPKLCLDFPNIKITNLEYKDEYNLIYFIAPSVLIFISLFGILIYYAIKKKKDIDNLGKLIPMDNEENGNNI